MRLTRMERRWMVSLFDAILPAHAEAGLDSGVTALPLDRFVGDLGRVAPGQFLLGLRAAIWVGYWSALVMRLRRFSRMSREERGAHLAWLSGSRIYFLREIPMLLKMVACLAYGALPQVQERVGLPPAGDTPPDWMEASAE